jgi:peptidoglycan hydrolase-like protein with peptidoglycan-binding domain
MSRSFWAAVGVGVVVFGLGALAADAARPSRPAAAVGPHRTLVSFPVPTVTHIAPQLPSPHPKRPARGAGAYPRHAARRGSLPTPAAGGVSTRPRPAPRPAPRRTPRPAPRRAPRLGVGRAVPGGRSVVLAAGAGYRPGVLRGGVRMLQRRLGSVGFGAGRVDGRYGPLTIQAVSRFQHACGLVVDGIAGARTLAALNASSTARHGGLAPGAGHHQRSGSPRVRTLQHRLARMGFTPGPADGGYGPLTTHAVSRFQHAHALPATGIATRRTLHALHIPTRTVTTPPHAATAATAAGPNRRHRRPARHAARAQTTAPVRSGGDSSEPPSGPPLTPILLGLLAVGAATIAASYHHTRTQPRPMPEPPPPGQPPPPRHAAHPAARQPTQP